MCRKLDVRSQAEFDIIYSWSYFILLTKLKKYHAKPFSRSLLFKNKYDEIEYQIHLVASIYDKEEVPSFII